MNKKGFFLSKSNQLIILIFFKYSLIMFLRSPIKCFLGIFVILLILNMWLYVHTFDKLVVPSCLCVAITRNTSQLFSLQLKEYKDNEMNLRVRYISKSFFPYFGYILANLLINIIASSIILINSSFYKDERELFVDINWYMVISSLLLLWMLYISSSFFLFFFIGPSIGAYCIAITFYLIAVYFLGCAYPYYIVKQYAWLDHLMYAFPPRYMFNVAQSGWVGRVDLQYDFWDGKNYHHVDYGLANNLLFPYSITIASIIILISSVIWVKYFKIRAKMAFFKQIQFNLENE